MFVELQAVTAQGQGISRFRFPWLETGLAFRQWRERLGKHGAFRVEGRFPLPHLQAQGQGVDSLHGKR